MTIFWHIYLVKCIKISVAKLEKVSIPFLKRGFRVTESNMRMHEKALQYTIGMERLKVSLPFLKRLTTKGTPI